jgi:hypothetical protein
MGPTRTTGENGSPPSDGAWTATGATALVLAVVAHDAVASVESIVAQTKRVGKCARAAKPSESASVMGGEDIGRPGGCQPRTARAAEGRARRSTAWRTASGSVLVRQLATMGNDVPLPRKGMIATPRERGPCLAGHGTSE